MNREPLTRSQSSDYIRLEGLQKLTNVTAHDWDLYILKELVDNALDADEMLQSDGKSPSIHIEMIYDRAAYGLRVNVTNRASFPLNYVSDLFDLKKRVSVKDYYNYPTRGAQGNALKTILGIPYALNYRYFSDYNLEETPLSITCGDQRVEVRFDVDELHKTVQLVTETKIEDDEVHDETTVSVGIFRFIQKRPRTLDELNQWAKAFARFNPHANFSFTFVIVEESGEVIEEGYDSNSHSDWDSKYDLTESAPIGWYTFSEFKELVYAILAHRQEYEQSAPSLGDIANQFGITRFPRTDEFTVATSLGDLMSEDGLRTASIRRLFKLLRQHSQDAPIPDLGYIGESHLLANCDLPESDDVEDSDTLFFYRRAEGGLEARITTNDAIHPFVLEIALNANDKEQRQLLIGINHTPTYQDPFFNKPLVPHEADLEDVQRSLEKLLDYYDLRDDTPVTLTVHLIAPNVEYENYGKWSISDEPYRDTLTRLIHEVVEEYREATRPPEPVDYLTEPAERILPEAIDMLAGRNFSENQLLAVIKRGLMTADDQNILDDLATSSADNRLLTVIRTYHAAKHIKDLYIRPSGRIAVPRHPHDSINVFFDNMNLLDLLHRYQSRAILLTPRESLEDLLIALEFPVHYDCAILRADGNFNSSLELLIYRLSLVASDVEEDSHFSLPKLWLVRDATLEAEQRAEKIRQMLFNRNLPSDLLIDLGLHVSDIDEYDVLLDKAVEPPDVNSSVLRKADLGKNEIQFLTEGYSARLDSMIPTVLAHWFETMIQRHGENLKAIPDAESLTGLVIEDLKSRFRRVVGDIAYESYHLDEVQAEVVGQWRSDRPDWASDLHSQLSQSLQGSPRQSWQNILENALNAMMQEYLNSERRDEIRDLIDNN